MIGTGGVLTVLFLAFRLLSEHAGAATGEGAAQLDLASAVPSGDAPSAGQGPEVPLLPPARKEAVAIEASSPLEDGAMASEQAGTPEPSGPTSPAAGRISEGLSEALKELDDSVLTGSPNTDSQQWHPTPAHGQLESEGGEWRGEPFTPSVADDLDNADTESVAASVALSMASTTLHRAAAASLRDDLRAVEAAAEARANTAAALQPDDMSLLGSAASSPPPSPRDGHHHQEEEAARSVLSQEGLHPDGAASGLPHRYRSIPLAHLQPLHPEWVRGRGRTQAQICGHHLILTETRLEFEASAGDTKPLGFLDIAPPRGKLYVLKGQVD